MRLVLALLLAGCPSSGPKDPAYTPAGPKPCERMADHVVGLMQAVDPKTGKQVEQNRETADAITRVLIDACTRDKWTQDAQKCFLELPTLEKADQCAPLLTVEQRNAADAAMASAFGAPPTVKEPGTGSGSN